MQSNSFTAAMVVDTVDHDHFIPLSVAVTLPEGHRVSAKQNLLGSFDSVADGKRVRVSEALLTDDMSCFVVDF